MVPASFFPCHSGEVSFNEFGGLWAGESSSVVAKGSVVGLGILGGEGDDGDVDVFAWESTRSRFDDPDVVSALCAGDKRF
jgi:hypothetical protein